MATLHFKTNINCGGCKASVTPFLKKEPRIKDWNVDINNSDKILAVDTDDLSTDEVIKIIGQAGFKAVAI